MTIRHLYALPKSASTETDRRSDDALIYSESSCCLLNLSYDSLNTLHYGPLIISCKEFGIACMQIWWSDTQMGYLLLKPWTLCTVVHFLVFTLHMSQDVNIKWNRIVFDIFCLDYTYSVICLFRILHIPKFSLIRTICLVRRYFTTCYI